MLPRCMRPVIDQLFSVMCYCCSDKHLCTMSLFISSAAATWNCWPDALLDPRLTGSCKQRGRQQGPVILGIGLYNTSAWLGWTCIDWAALELPVEYFIAWSLNDSIAWLYSRTASGRPRSDIIQARLRPMYCKKTCCVFTARPHCSQCRALY